MDPTEFRDHRLHLTGIQNLIAAHTAGRGVIVTSIHYGNPEYVSRVLAAYHLPFLALVERIEPPELFALMQSYRQIANARFVGADLGGVKEAIRHLRRGGMLAVLVDRDIQHNGIEVPFFALARGLPAPSTWRSPHRRAAARIRVAPPAR
ncbi:MAG: lysophospholipid acyltransferase family protein [Dehalococcoidia bacterium]